MMLTWAICISVLSIFIIPFSTSLIFPASGPTLKSDRVNSWIYYSGENVTLHCYTSKNNCSISFTYRNDDKISSDFVTFINGTYARLDRPVQDDDPDNTKYNCMTNCSGSNSPSNPIAVRTEYRPQNVTNLWYRWLGRTSLHVGWDLGLPDGYKCSIDKCSNNPSTQVAVLYTTNSTGEWRNCTSLNSTSCIIANFTVPWFSLSVNISNTRQDVASSLFPDRLLFDHVKPLPVKLSPGKAVNSTCVELEWEFVPGAHNYTVHYSTTGSSKKMVTKEQNTTTVCNLHPSLEYNFEVVAVEGYESDPAKTSVVMPEDGTVY